MDSKLNFSTVAALLFDARTLLCLLATASVRPRRPPPTAPPTADLSIVFHNVWVQNEWPQLCARQLVRSGADVVVVCESTRSFVAHFDAVGGAAQYVHRFGHDLNNGDDEYAVTVFSRHALTDVALLPLASGADRALLVCVTVAGVRLAAVNLFACLDPPYIGRWRAQMLALARVLRREVARAGALVLVGDLNTTCFRPEFQTLLRVAGLTDAHAAAGRASTRSLSLNGVTPCFVRVDHVLVAGVHVCNIVNLAMAGSDHKPFRVDLALFKSQKLHFSLYAS